MRKRARIVPASSADKAKRSRRLRDPVWMRWAYEQAGLSHRQIAELLGCNRTTVREWMRKHEIDPRRAAH
jgi:transposase